jgi:alpha-L-fucosidase
VKCLSFALVAIATTIPIASINAPDRACGQAPADVADGGVEKGNPRDVAAANEALRGWWTESQKTRDQRLAWWREARFGCFIHWGVYAGPAGEWNGKNGGGYAEHLMRHERIPLAEYKEKVVSVFDPEKFNANDWVKLIKGAGMKYVVITAKHHDGFAMWPSDVNKYNLRDATKFQRDPMLDLSMACRANGLRFGFYYSHAYDWEDPNAPGNDWDYMNPGGDHGFFGGKNWFDEHPEVLERVRRYVDGKAIPQLKELIAKYHPDIFWFDTSGKLPFSEQLRIVEAVRKADPIVVINGRAARGLGRNFGDYLDTGDRPAELRPTPGDWECIPTTNESYGYHKLDHSHKPVSYFIRLLAMAAAKGGNMLLNIGPMGNGQIAPEDQAILRGIGDWMSVNGYSIYGTERTPLERQAWGESTLRINLRMLKSGPVEEDTLYLHVFAWPPDGRLVVGGLQQKPGKELNAFLMADPKTSLKVEPLGEYDTVIHVPASAPDATDSVILLEMRGGLKTHPGRLLASKGPVNRLLAFDAATSGKGFKYGDGKAAAYCVSGFKKPGDALAWKVRLNEPATLAVSVKYSTTSDQRGGEYELKLGDQTLECRLDATQSAKNIRTAEVGKVSLPAGEMELRFQHKSDAGDLQLFEIDLAPAP